MCLAFKRRSGLLGGCQRDQASRVLKATALVSLLNMPTRGYIYSHDWQIHLLQKFDGGAKGLAYLTTGLKRKTEYRVKDYIVLVCNLCRILR